MINCIIVDDEQSAINVLKRHIQTLGMLHLAYTTTNPFEALQVMNQQPVDLAFLDIQMPGMSGLDLARALPVGCKVIFITGYSEFVSEAYDLEGRVVDYLLKPIAPPRFARAVQRAIKGMGLPQDPQQLAYDDESLEHDYIFVKGEQKNKMQQIYLYDIDYIQAMRNYMAIYHSGQKTMVLMSMKEIEANLPAQHFVRVQKSFIVALHKIATVVGNKLRLKNRDVEITVGDSYKAQFTAATKGRVVSS
jgi:two-component system, LytTR family, response regulator